MIHQLQGSLLVYPDRRSLSAFRNSVVDEKGRAPRKIYMASLIAWCHRRARGSRTKRQIYLMAFVIAVDRWVYS